LKTRIKIVVLTLISFVGSGFANSTNLNFILGSSFSQLSNKQYVSPAIGLVNSYNSNEPTQYRPFYGIGVEYNFDHPTTVPITLGLGLSIYSVNLGNISGIETPGINILPTPIDKLRYKIQAKSSIILLEPKVIYTAFLVEPYIFGGLGYARNKLSNFTESTIPGSLATPSASPYSNNVKTSFAFDAGLGLQYFFRECENNRAVVFYMEYRYFDLGKSKLGRGSTQTTNEHIIVNNTTNVVDFGITYRF